MRIARMLAIFCIGLLLGWIAFSGVLPRRDPACKDPQDGCMQMVSRRG